MNTQEAYDQLAYYTLSHKNPAFIHQHIVDAYTAQHANKQTKPIAITFALVGLYLFLEKGFTGRQVQLMHMRMAQVKREWPKFTLPHNRGEITVVDVLSIQPREKRDEMIRTWCESVWDAYTICHTQVAELLRNYLV